jgi:hypothetical protein
MLRRRFLLLAAALPGLGGAWPGLAVPAAAVPVTVWRDAACGCCRGWIDHLRAEGFAVEDRVVGALGAVRRMLGTPNDLLSCHAARVADFALEGHVPAAAIRRLLAERPAGIRGLAVPGMPTGAPGMEVPGQPAETYDVIAIGGVPPRPIKRFAGARPA